MTFFGPNRSANLPKGVPDMQAKKPRAFPEHAPPGAHARAHYLSGADERIRAAHAAAAKACQSVPEQAAVEVAHTEPKA
jgi:hypothetical protein